MSDNKCVFSATLVAEDYACELAQSVVRRGGPEIACASIEASQCCQQLFTCLKLPVLTARGLEDDLTVIPHSILVKIQYAGLSILMQRLDAAGDGNGKITNIHALVAQAIEHYGAINDVPCAEFTDTITAYKIRRRRGQ